MPDPNQIHPSQLRERGMLETDEQYVERMKALDARDRIINSIPLRKGPYDDLPPNE